MSIPLVSICCITYNHEAFLRDAIEGFLSQVTDFPFEIIIHDDASTDRTPDIIREYAGRYPDIIIPVFQSVNQNSQGKKCTAIILPYARGKYVALCDGDDYWTSQDKLQKQYDYMEAHPDCALSFHASEVLFAGRPKPADASSDIIPSAPVRQGRDGISVAEWLRLLYIPFSTVMFRAFQEPLPAWILQLKRGIDWPLFLWIFTRFGIIGFVESDTPMAVYRRHEAGVTYVSMQLNSVGRKQRVEDSLGDAYQVMHALPFRHRHYIRPRLYDLHLTLAYEYAWATDLTRARKHFIRAVYYLLPHGSGKSWDHLVRFALRTFTPGLNAGLMRLVQLTHRFYSGFSR